MKKSELFRFIHRQSLGDCTEVYDSELLKPFSVKELVEAVLEDEKEWGYINVESNIHPSASLEYSHGKIVNNNIGSSDLEKTVTSLKANGGWSRMDFLITIGTSDDKKKNNERINLKNKQNCKIMAKETKTIQDLDLNKLAETQKGICKSAVGNLNNQNIPKTQEDRARVFQQETPFFGNNDNFAQAITEAGIKAAKATREFNMKEIKAKLIADLCVEMTKNAGSSPIVRNIANNAREIADKALQNL